MKQSGGNIIIFIGQGVRIVGCLVQGGGRNVTESLEFVVDSGVEW